MGTKTQVLLITALLLDQARTADIVAIREHSAFWLWSGVKASDGLKSVQTVYLHQGEVVVRSDSVVLQRFGLSVSRLSFLSIWPTVCFTTPDVPEEILVRIIWLMQRWQTAGNNVVGLQVDFDTVTCQLTNYTRFLQQLHQQFPAKSALGVTRLLDWTETGGVIILNALTVDELVVQNYQGRRMVMNHQAYLSALSRLRIPFKLGLVRSSSRDPLAEAQSEKSLWYRGMVVFILSPSRR